MAEDSIVTVGQVMNAAINLFAEDCIQMAKENWCSSQVEMLETLFDAARHGCEYKCVRCEYLEKAADGSENVDCIWEPREENGYKRPCEEKEEE